MTIFILLIIASALASALDVWSTKKVLDSGGSELNTFIYGSHPSLRCLVVVAVVLVIAALVIGLIALRYDVVAACVMPSFLFILRLLAGINNVYELRK